MNIPRFAGLVLLWLASAAMAENWAQWRGPAFNGTTTETGLPEKLDNSSAAWTVDLPGRGASTPIVWSDQIFLTVQSKDGKLWALSFDAKSGKEQWRREVGGGARVKNLADSCSPSAVTDGKTVIFYFSNGDLAAFDLSGNPLWKRNIQKDHGTFNFQWIYGSSPTLYKGKLYIPVIHRDVPGNEWRAPRESESLADSYLLAINPADGKDIWRVVRPPDSAARVEAKESYATLIPYEGKDRSELLIVGGDIVTSHDPETGKELWRAGDWNPQRIDSYRMVPSVVAAGDLIIACAPKGGPVSAFKAGGNGDVTSTHTAWKSKEFTSDVAVPAFYQNNLYVLQGEKKALTCVDPATGKAKWSQKLESRPVFRASPTVADGKVYVINEAGEVWVISANEPKILFQHNFGTPDKAHATIVAANGQVLFRTGDKLYAFKK